MALLAFPLQGFSIVVVYQFYEVKLIISYLVYCRQWSNPWEAKVTRLDIPMKGKGLERSESVNGMYKDEFV